MLKRRNFRESNIKGGKYKTPALYFTFGFVLKMSANWTCPFPFKGLQFQSKAKFVCTWKFFSKVSTMKRRLYLSRKRKQRNLDSPEESRPHVSSK